MYLYITITLSPLQKGERHRKLERSWFLFVGKMMGHFCLCLKNYNSLVNALISIGKQGRKNGDLHKKRKRRWCLFMGKMMGHFRHKSQAGKRLQILINRERELRRGLCSRNEGVRHLTKVRELLRERLFSYFDHQIRGLTPLHVYITVFL
jgi:hypothetical protein